MYLLGNLPFFKIHVNCFMAGDDSLCASAAQNACCGRGTWCSSLSFEAFLLPDSVQFRCSAVSDYLRPHGLQHARPPVHLISSLTGMKLLAKN